MSDQPISTASRMICSLFSSRDTKTPSWPSWSPRRMNWVARVVLPAPDRPITTVVLFSFTPPSKSGLRPQIPLRILRTRFHPGRGTKYVRPENQARNRMGSGEDRLEPSDEIVDHLPADPVAQDAVQAIHDLAVVKQGERRDDIDRVVVPERVVLVVEVHGGEAPGVRGGEPLELLFEPPAERAPRGPKHDDGRLVRLNDRLLERRRIFHLEHRVAHEVIRGR